MSDSKIVDFRPEGKNCKSNVVELADLSFFL